MSTDKEPLGWRRDPRFDQADYRPDLYGHVEGPPDAPQQVVDAALAVTCPDCQVNVFIKHIDDHWKLLIAHDDTCPWYEEHVG